MNFRDYLILDKFSMAEKIQAPCIHLGVVNSVWQTNTDGGPPGLYAVNDNDSKEAECRCPWGACCVDGQNYVIQGYALSVGIKTLQRLYKKSQNQG